MKQILHLLFLFTVVLLGSSCEKNADEIKATASITVINAAVGNGSIKVNTSTNNSFAYAKAPDLAYGTSGTFGAYIGKNMVKIVNSTDTNKVLFDRRIDLKAISTLYVAGKSPNIDTIFKIENNFPYILPYRDDSDQSMYIRFINLSPNSTPLSINIVNSSVKEVASLGYKAITEFKKYPALATTANYIFEIKDVASNTVQSTIQVPITANRYKTISLVIKGLLGTKTGTDIFNVLQVNYN